MLESGQMPPEDAPQPTPEHHDQLLGWTQRLLDAEILARAGDPGRVIVRRLSNAQYDNTTGDLTGLDLHPTRDFPADGAAGEGFTNSGDGLVMSPVLLGKYWNAGKQIAAHAVLVPDGFHFSPATTRADWSQESIARIRALYGEYGMGASEGRLDFVPYLKATLAHRFRLQTGATTITAIAAKNRLNPKYLGQLWRTLTVGPATEPLSTIRDQWRRAKPDDVEALADRIRVWQPTVWKFNKIGSYVQTVWQQPVEPTIVERQSFRLKPKLQPGQTEVQLYLALERCWAIQPGRKSSGSSRASRPRDGPRSCSAICGRTPGASRRFIAPSSVKRPNTWPLRSSWLTIRSWSRPKSPKAKSSIRCC